jgi:putative inorganic carbon (HCO3(-)) transporter
VPLIINPAALDIWYRPKIGSVYALVTIAGVAWMLKTAFRDRPFSSNTIHLAIPVCTYLIAALLSTIFSINIKLSFLGDPLRVEGLLTVLSYGALFFLFASQVRSKDQQDTLFSGLLFAAALVSIYAIIQYAGYDPTEHYFYKYWRRGPGVGSTIGNQNFLGKYLVLVLPIVFSYCFYTSNRKSRLAAAFCLIVCFAALIATFTRASWLSAIVGLILFVSLAFRRFFIAGRLKQVILYLCLLFAVGVIFNFYTFNDGARENHSFKRKEPGGVVKRTVSSLQLNEGRGVATRLYVWEKAINLIKQRPWFGYGLETFQIAFRPHNRDYTKRFNDFTMVDRIHNNYLDTAFSMGLAGLAAYLALLVSFLMYLWKLMQEMKHEACNLLFIGIFSGFCGYLINDLFIFSVVSVSPVFWSLMGLTVAAGRLARAEGASTVHPAQTSKAMVSQTMP